MYDIRVRLITVGSWMMLLAGCSAPETPQEVAAAFWQSVINDDAKGAVAYSTLSSIDEYDSFSRDWTGFQPSWGRVVIDNEEARIVSEFSRADGPRDAGREFVTHLVVVNDAWKVDYARTGRAVRGGALVILFDNLGQVGDELSDQMSASADEFSQELSRIGDHFAELADEVGQRASESLRRDSEELRRKLREFAESVERALRDENERLSPRDSRTLREAAAELNDRSDTFSRPTSRAVTSTSRAIRDVQKQLSSTDDDVVGEYKIEWRASGEQIEEALQHMRDELAAEETAQM